MSNLQRASFDPGITCGIHGLQPGRTRCRWCGFDPLFPKQDREPTQEERFWANVDKGGDCWLWTAGKSKAGYGQIRHRNKVAYAHRLSYEMAFGPIPPRLHVCHRCDTPACVRPDHLFAGTALQNITDCIAKGRARNVGPKGERAPAAKLTVELVKEARRLYANGGIGLTSLAPMFGVSVSAIHAVVTRKSWSHVE